MAVAGFCQSLQVEVFYIGFVTAVASVTIVVISGDDNSTTGDCKH